MLLVIENTPLRYCCVLPLQSVDIRWSHNKKSINTCCLIKQQMKRFKRSGYNLVIIVSIALIEILLFTGSKALMNVMKSVSYFEFYFSFDNGHAMTCHTGTFFCSNRAIWWISCKPDIHTSNYLITRRTQVSPFPFSQIINPYLISPWN